LREVVGDHDDGDALLLQAGNVVVALLLEAEVAHGEDLIDEQQFGFEEGRDREPEAHVHAGRVGAHRLVNELLEAGELDDARQQRLDFGAGQADQEAVHNRVFAA
jgi:hypothetical protein